MRTPSPDRRRAAALLPLLAGTACILLGLAVMAGWHLHQSVLVQIRPHYAAMAYNTALMFVLVGLGMAALASGYRRGAIAAGAAVGTVALLTLAQYLLAVDFGIDQLLIRPFLTTGMSSPGRMGPNAALGFVLLSAALIVLAGGKQNDRRQLIAGLLSTAVVALGATALVGYMTGVEPMYGWAGRSRMALHTAIALVIAGIALGGFAWRYDEREHLRRLSLVVMCGLLTATLMLWQALVVHEQAQMNNTVKIELASVRDEIETRLQRRIDALVPMAGRWESLGDPINQREWEFEAALILKHFPGYQAIAWIDTDLRVRRIAPLYETTVSVLRARDLLRAGRPQQVTLKRMPQSPTLNLYVPVFRQDRLQGYVVGVFDIERTLLTERMAPDFAIAIFDGQEQIHARDVKHRADKWAQSVTLQRYGLSWRVQAAPNQEVVAELTTWLPGVVLSGGLLLSGLLAWTIYLIQVARRRAHQVENINRELNREIREHHQTAAALQQKTEVIQLLLNAVIAANQAHSVEEAVRACIDGICTLQAWPVGNYFAVQDRRLLPTAIWCSADARFQRFCDLNETLVVRGGFSLPVQVLESGKPVWTMDLTQQLEASAASVAQELGLRTALAFPVLLKTEVAGVFQFFSTQALAPDTQFLDVMTQIGRQLGHVIERTRADELIHKLNTDLEHRVQERTHALEREVGERKHAEETAKTRALQQAVVADIGQRALAGLDIATLMQEVAVVTARTLQVEFSKILELSEDGRSLLLCAGVGWKPGLVGVYKVDTGNGSQAGYALSSKGPVIVQDLSSETRFRGLALLSDHGVVSGMSVIIEGDVRPFGVLGAHTRLRRNFTQDDIHFLQAMANVLAAALVRQRTEALLAQEKERLAVTLQSIGDGVITTDTEGRVVMINQVAQNLTGWTSEQAYGRPLSEIFPIVHERTREPRENPVQQVLATGRTVHLANHTVLLARDGTERVIADSGAPIRDRGNRIIGVVLVFRDISAQQKMEADLLKGQKLESIGVLAGGIAHDFNNILTAILGNVALARMYANPGDKIHEALSEAEKAFWRARDLTQQLLTFAKGGAPIKRLGAISEIVADSARFALSGTHVRGNYDFPQGLWPVEHDPGQISQVVNNLVINAVQAMPEGGELNIAAENITLTDSPLPLAPGAYVKIALRDEGVGISSQHLSKIFDPYFTTKQKGSGLGLATAYSIIRRHDGHIQVESRMGVGSTFTIYLPAVQDVVAAQPDQGTHEGR